MKFNTIFDCKKYINEIFSKSLVENVDCILIFDTTISYLCNTQYEVKH